MDIFKRLLFASSAFASAWSGPGRVEQWPQLFGRWGRPTQSKVAVNESNAQTLSTVWACIGIRADTMAQLPIGLYRREGDTVIQVTDDPVADLLRDGPTPDYASSLMLYGGQAQVDTWGNSYQEIVRDARGVPVSLHFLNPDPFVTYPVINQEGRFAVIESYRTMSLNGTERFIPPEDVIHVKGHTLDGLVGVSVITAAREAIGLGLATERFGATYFANESKSGGYIIQPVQTNTRSKRQQQDNVSESDMDGQGGPENSHKPKILDPGVRFIPTTIPPNDAQFLETRQYQVSEIARFYRVPLVFLDSSSATAWGTGIEELKIGFVELTVIPMSLRWAPEMTRKLLTPSQRAAGYFVALDTTRLMRGNAVSQMQADGNAIQYGIKTRNEVRRDRGLNPIEGGDIPLIPVNLADGRKPPEAADTAQPEGNEDAPQE